MQITLANNQMQCHISEFPPGTYKKGHKHGVGAHVAGWRMPGAEAGKESFASISRAVLAAERGKFDFVFFADAVNTGNDTHPLTASSNASAASCIAWLSTTRSNSAFAVTIACKWLCICSR